MKKQKREFFGFDFINLTIWAIVFSFIIIIFFKGIDFLNESYSNTTFYSDSLLYLGFSTSLAILLWLINKITSKKLIVIELLLSTSLAAIGFIIIIILLPILALLTLGYFFSMCLIIICLIIKSFFQKVKH